MSTRIGYFGKLATRSDFVKSGEQHALAGLLDVWIDDTLAQLITNTRWKLHYDALAPLHFAFVGPHSRHVVAGHLVASGDLSGRRFPFIAMSALEVPAPGTFLPGSPMALAAAWRQLADLTAAVQDAADPAGALQAVTGAVLDADAVRANHAGELDAFAAAHDIAALEALLAGDGHRHDVRGIVLGIGLLLQPFEWTGGTRLDRSLALPLPRDPALRPSVAAFWLSLVAPFLRRQETGHQHIELALFMAELRGRPTFVIGFAGATPGTLRAVIDPEYGAGHLIGFDDVAWVDDMIAGEHGVQRLSACLAQGSLSLRAALDLFRQTFA